ncbi:hypothetical protein X975_19767, partial [Stegodyphus mimosarum]
MALWVFSLHPQYFVLFPFNHEIALLRLFATPLMPEIPVSHPTSSAPSSQSLIPLHTLDLGMQKCFEHRNLSGCVQIMLSILYSSSKL